MSLFKYVSAKTAIQILRGSIRFTQPGAFNDPFELLPQFAASNIAEEAFYALSVGCVGSRRKGILKDGAKLDDHNKGDFQARQIVKALNDVIGILCLSKNPASLLMWGHYADEYRGAIIEFDEKHPFFNGLIPVIYKSKRPIYDISDFIGQPFPIADLCIKPKDWAYEREVRIVRPLAECTEAGKHNGHRIMTMSVPLECIRSVVMGERMGIDCQREIWRLVKDTNAALSLAAVSNWDYKFRNEIIKFSGEMIGSPLMSPRTAHIFSEDQNEFGELARWMIEKHPQAEIANLGC